MFTYNEKTDMYECYHPGEGRMIPYEGKPFVSLSDEIQEAAMRGEWCGWCKSSFCETCGGDLPCVKYEEYSVTWGEEEREEPKEEPEDPFEGFQYEDRRTRTPRTATGHTSYRPQRIAR